MGIDHALHRKKILNSVRRLAVTVQAARVAEGGVVAAAGAVGGGQIVPQAAGAVGAVVDPMMPELALATGGGAEECGGAGGAGDIAPRVKLVKLKCQK